MRKYMVNNIVFNIFYLHNLKYTDHLTHHAVYLEIFIYIRQIYII